MLTVLTKEPIVTKIPYQEVIATHIPLIYFFFKVRPTRANPSFSSVITALHQHPDAYLPVPHHKSTPLTRYSAILAKAY
jgi:hypothetical protein